MLIYPDTWPGIPDARSLNKPHRHAITATTHFHPHSLINVRVCAAQPLPHLDGHAPSSHSIQNTSPA